MISDVLIGLVAVVVLIAVIGGLAWYYLRGDDDGPNPDAEIGRATVDDDVADPMPLLALPVPHSATTALAEDGGEPTDGDIYAAELHAIGQAAATDVLELHLAWYPGRMPAWLPLAGMGLEDWERCLKWGHRRYWQARRQAWKRETLDWWEDYRAWRREMGLAA